MRVVTMKTGLSVTPLADIASKMDRPLPTVHSIARRLGVPMYPHPVRSEDNKKRMNLCVEPQHIEKIIVETAKSRKQLGSGYRRPGHSRKGARKGKLLAQLQLGLAGAGRQKPTLAVIASSISFPNNDEVKGPGAREEVSRPAPETNPIPKNAALRQIAEIFASLNIKHVDLSTGEDGRRQLKVVFSQVFEEAITF